MADHIFHLFPLLDQVLLGFEFYNPHFYQHISPEVVLADLHQYFLWHVVWTLCKYFSEAFYETFYCFIFFLFSSQERRNRYFDFIIEEASKNYFSASNKILMIPEGDYINHVNAGPRRILTKACFALASHFCARMRVNLVFCFVFQ